MTKLNPVRDYTIDLIQYLFRDDLDNGTSPEDQLTALIADLQDPSTDIAGGSTVAPATYRVDVKTAYNVVHSLFSTTTDGTVYWKFPFPYKDAVHSTQRLPNIVSLSVPSEIQDNTATEVVADVNYVDSLLWEVSVAGDAFSSDEFTDSTAATTNLTIDANVGDAVVVRMTATNTNGEDVMTTNSVIIA